jgi:hypothetical protein
MNDNQFSMDDSARENAELKITRYAQVKISELPHMSDNCLRLNVPAGLQNDGTQSKRYGIEQAHADPSRSAIRSESE